MQDRLLLLLEESEDYKMVRDILKSPLGLAKVLITDAFASEPEKGLLRHKKRLDRIKDKIAGIRRAEELSEYKIADYFMYLFAFQQYFHSSYRARQGMSLEAVIHHCFEDIGVSSFSKTSGRQEKVKELFSLEEEPNQDIDFLGVKNSKVMIGQVRSTDVTGGTTAKASVIDVLKEILEKERATEEEGLEVLYPIVVWEGTGKEQKPSLIKKVWNSLKGVEKVSDSYEEEFKENFDDEGWNIPGTSIMVKLIYRYEGLEEEINDFFASESKLCKIWESLTKWDDLWLSYALTSLELENLMIDGKTNFQLLEEKLEENDILITKGDVKNYKESSREIAHTLVEVWDKDTLPVSSPSETLNYIRDLILLKMIDLKVSNGFVVQKEL